MDTFCRGSKFLVIYFDQRVLFIDSVLFQQLNKKSYVNEQYTMHNADFVTV